MDPYSKDINLSVNTNLDESKLMKIGKNVNISNNKSTDGKMIQNYKSYTNLQEYSDYDQIKKFEKNEERSNSASKKMKKNMIKTKHKKYNDVNDGGFDNKFDKKYDYSNKEKETLPPLKHPESIYSNIYAGLKSNLDWEKQFKSLDNLRTIMYYNKELLYKDAYYFSIIFDQVLQIANTIRPHLAKNALLTMSEIFEIEDLNMDQKVDSIVKCLVKKIIEKNTFIGAESRETLFNFIKHCSFDKIISFLITSYGKNHSVEYYKVIIDCMSQAVESHKEQFINSQIFHNGMIFIANQFAVNKKLRDSIKEFFMNVNTVFNNDQERMEKLLKRYYSNESLKYLVNMIYEE